MLLLYDDEYDMGGISSGNPTDSVHLYRSRHHPRQKPIMGEEKEKVGHLYFERELWGFRAGSV
jgi:hypothetical protein